MTHGVSAISIDYNEEHNRVQVRVRVEDKWLDLLMTSIEAVEMANMLLFCQSKVDRSVEGKPIEVYNKEDEQVQDRYQEAVEKQQAKPDLRLVEPSEEQSGNLI